MLSVRFLIRVHTGVVNFLYRIAGKVLSGAKFWSFGSGPNPLKIKPSEKNTKVNFGQVCFVVHVNLLICVIQRFFVCFLIDTCALLYM